MGITKHFYTEIEPDPSGIKQFILDTHPASPICEKCGIEMKLKGAGMKKGTHRVIFDIDNGTPIKILYNPKRYRCSGCKAVIQDPNAPPVTKEKGSEEFQTFIAQKALSNSRMTAKEVGAEYELSPGYVSNAVKKHISFIKTVVSSYLPCSKLWFEPYEYQEKPCFIIFGYSPQLKMWVLLDIIEAGNDKLLTDLYTKVSTPQEMRCPLDPWLLKTLADHFKNATIKVPISEFEAKLDLALDQTVKGSSDEISRAANAAEREIKKGIKKKGTFANAQEMEDWFCELSGDADPILNATVFPDIYSQMLPYMKYFYADIENPEKEPDCVKRIRAMILKYHRSRVPMEAMQLHLLYQSEFFRRTLKKNKQMIYRCGYSFAGVQKMPQIEEWVNCYTLIPTE